jgi:hypothetical protein
MLRIRGASITEQRSLIIPNALSAVIYESAPRVNRSFMSFAAPAGAAVVGLRYTTTEPAGDRATLESDLSAAPEAEMGWGVRTSPAFRFADVSLISARKR